MLKLLASKYSNRPKSESHFLGKKLATKKLATLLLSVLPVL